MDKTILLVDDDIDLLRSIAELLRSLGYSVLDHFDPQQAVECFRLNAEIDCVLTDIDMPGMDGISLLTELRRMRPIVDGIFMTGGPQHRVGPSEEVLQKPFTFGELVQALENCGNSIN
jgi:CheY-like chemotaxis protein